MLWRARLGGGRARLINWQAIGLKAWRGAVVATLVGVLAAIPIGCIVALLGQPVVAGVVQMIAEGIVLAAIGAGVHEWAKQKGLWQS